MNKTKETVRPIDSKGLREHTGIKNAKSNTYQTLTRQMLEELIEGMNADPRRTTVYQGCLTHGIVMRTDMSPAICDNPECKSCQQMHKAIKDYAEQA
jgi:hypothetical protein